MKMFSELSLRAIRGKMEKIGVEMNDVQFNALTYSELKKIYKKAKKAYNLYKQVDEIINKKKAPTPEVPFKAVEEKSAEMPVKNKIIKGA